MKGESKYIVSSTFLCTWDRKSGAFSLAAGVGHASFVSGRERHAARGLDSLTGARVPFNLTLENSCPQKRFPAAGVLT